MPGKVLAAESILIAPHSSLMGWVPSLRRESNALLRGQDGAEPQRSPEPTSFVTALTTSSRGLGDASRPNWYYLRNAARELSTSVWNIQKCLFEFIHSATFLCLGNPQTRSSDFWDTAWVGLAYSLLYLVLLHMLDPRHMSPQEGPKHATLSPPSRPGHGGFPLAQMSFLDSSCLASSLAST